MLVKYGGYTPMEAIVANTRENAYAMGLEGELGTIETGKLAEPESHPPVLDADPAGRHPRPPARQVDPPRHHHQATRLLVSELISRTLNYARS